MLFENLPITLTQAQEKTATGWLSETVEQCITKVAQVSRPISPTGLADSRPMTAELLFRLLESQLDSKRVTQIELTALDLLEVYQAVSGFFPGSHILGEKPVVADQFPESAVIQEFTDLYPYLQEKILKIPPQQLEGLIDVCIRINHCFNIMSEVERLSRTQGTGSLVNVYELAKQNGFGSADIDRLIIIWTGTAHPNRFVTLPIEKTIGELVDNLVGNNAVDKNVVGQLFCTMLNAKVIPDLPPKRSAEASYITRTFAEAGVEGLKKLFRQDLAARRDVWGNEASYPSYAVEFHLWPTFDWDGQRNPDNQEMIDSVRRNRQLACEVLTKELNSIIATAPEHIEFEFDNGTVSAKEILARFLNRIRAIQAGQPSHDPITQERLVNGLSAIIDAIKKSPDALTYKNLIDDIAELRFLAENVGLHLVTGENRQNSEYHEKVIEQISSFLGVKEYSSKTEDEKIKFLASLLSAPQKIATIGDSLSESIENLPKDAQQYFKILLSLKDELLANPKCCDRTIISLTTSTSDILEVELFLLLAGINRKNNSGEYTNARLEIVPLFERPEDKIICDQIFGDALKASPSLLSLSRSYGRLSAMAGYSDGQMRGGPGDRELSREVEERVSSVAQSYKLLWAIEHGLGPGVGRGGGFNGDQSMLTPEAVKSEYIHFTIQGTAIGKLLRVSTSACRQAITGIRNFVEGLARETAKNTSEQEAFKAVRKEVFAHARDLYSDLIGRGKVVNFVGSEEAGEDVFFASLNLMFPPEYLDGLKQVSRPLFRFDQAEGQTFFNGLQAKTNIWVPYESFRAVPNNQISDGTRLCYVSLYSWGAILQNIRDLKGDEYLQKMYREDRSFQADVNGALLALQVANIPFALTLYRAQYASFKDAPLVQELFKTFDKIEEDYKLLLDGVAVLEPVLTDRVKSTIGEVRKVRSLKDPTTYVLQTVRAAITGQSHLDPSNAARYSNVTKLISVAMGTSLDTGS